MRNGIWRLTTNIMKSWVRNSNTGEDTEINALYQRIKVIVDKDGAKELEGCGVSENMEYSIM